MEDKNHLHSMRNDRRECEHLRAADHWKLVNRICWGFFVFFLLIFFFFWPAFKQTKNEEETYLDPSPLRALNTIMEMVFKV